MTQTEKARAYDEALERARKLKENPQSVFNEYSPKEGDTICDYIFPELRESEDEKIRKELIEHIKDQQSSFISAPDCRDKYEEEENDKYNSWLAWLEKQGEQKPFNDTQEYLKGVDRVQNYEELTKFEKGFDRIADTYAHNKNKEGYNSPWYTKERAAEMLHWAKEELGLIEKQGEQKKSFHDMKRSEQLHANKAKPKFKSGDWIVFNGRTLYIEEVVQGYYRTISVGGIPNSYDWDIDNVARLWTIQDAKPGDVLYHKAENGIEYIVMNKGLNEHNNIDSYFRYSSINGFGTDIPSVLSAKCDSITPAIKEQRDLLFQKMKEEGYEWDAEKKELKNIREQHLISNYFNAEYERGKVDALKSAAWSEEDKRMLDYAIDMVEWYSGKNEDKSRLVSDWLKSLRQRIEE